MQYLARTMLIGALLSGGVASAQQQFLPTNRLLRSRSVRAAFQEALAPARPWTVEIRNGDKRIAYGAVVAADGKVVTKLSEVQEALRFPAAAPKGGKGASADQVGGLNCRLSDGRKLPATLIAEHTATDLALLQISATNLPTVVWANTPKPELGRWLVSASVRGEAAAIGIVSAQRRKIREERTPGILGVRIKQGRGPAEIEEVFEKSAAAAAGIESGDIIERLDTTDIENGQALVRYVKHRQPGDVVQVSYRRGEEKKTVEVTLSHPFGEFLSQFAQQIRMGGELSHRRSGFDDVFSHDGQLKPEDCGGPVVNLSGAAVGLNIARAARTETLVLPADVVQQALGEMLASSQTAAAE